jgi:hypothetical protein
MAAVTTLAELKTFLQGFESHNSVFKLVFGNENELEKEIQENEIPDGQYILFAEYPAAPLENNSESHFINFNFGLNLLIPSDGVGTETYADELVKMDDALAVLIDFTSWVLKVKRDGQYPSIELLANDLQGNEPVTFWGSANAIGYRTEISLRYPAYFGYEPSNYS